MSSETPTGGFPQPIGQPPIWPTPQQQAPVYAPPHQDWAVPEPQEIVPDVSLSPDWGNIANGLANGSAAEPEAPPSMQWTLLSLGQYGETESLTEGAFVEGMGTVVRTVITNRTAASVATSFLPGVKIADGKLVPFGYC